MKRYLLAVLAVFVVGSVLDFVIHGLILMPTYAATAELWRPMAEMKMGLLRATGLVSAACFTGLYAWLVNPKSPAHGAKFGLLYGLATGIPMGFATYAIMPVPVFLAVAWSTGALVETTVAGLIVGGLIKN
jgi:hypothetical protein